LEGVGKIKKRRKELWYAWFPDKESLIKTTVEPINHSGGVEKHFFSSLSAFFPSLFLSDKLTPD
jgi:hypothetical protein